MRERGRAWRGDRETSRISEGLPEDPGIEGGVRGESLDPRVQHPFTRLQLTNTSISSAAAHKHIHSPATSPHHLTTSSPHHLSSPVHLTTPPLLTTAPHSAIAGMLRLRSRGMGREEGMRRNVVVPWPQVGLLYQSLMNMELWWNNNELQKLMSREKPLIRHLLPWY